VLSVSGSLFSGWLTDRLARSDVRWQIRIPVIGTSVAMVLGFGYLLVGSDMFMLSMACMLIYSFFTSWWAPATYAALSLVVPTERRATASAMVLMAGALLGNGVGPIVAGWLSDVLNTVAPGEGLRYAMAIMMCTLLPAVWAFYRALQHYPGAYRKAHAPWQLPHEGGRSDREGFLRRLEDDLSGAAQPGAAPGGVRAGLARAFRAGSSVPQRGPARQGRGPVLTTSAGRCRRAEQGL
jgi:MFS family permease